MSLLEAASGLAARCLGAHQLLALRNRYLALRTKLHPLMRALYGTFDAEALRAHLQQRIGTDFEILMVHSSVNHMQPMFTGSALDLVHMLTSFCGAERTLVMPAFYFGDPAAGGTRETFRARPRFDVRKTPSQMGLVSELFRRSKGVIPSRHPVYRVSALGPLAEQLTRGHEFARTPAGRDTPFDFMANRNTLIIGIGKPFEVLTQVHHAEDVLGDDFPVPRAKRDEDDVSLTLVDGQQEIPFTLPQGGLTWTRNMWKLRAIMGAEHLQEWQFHHIPLFATRAADVTAMLLAAAKRGVTLYEQP
jgi:aminoglycoside 3-N-acetyltransferase